MNNIRLFEIQADDPGKAVEFYSNVFEWKFTRDANIPIEYWRISANGMNGGLLKRPAKVPSPEHGTNAYVCSMEVKNFDETAMKILDNGGLVAMPKFAVLGRCWQGYFLDTQGNTFGIFQVDEKAS